MRYVLLTAFCIAALSLAGCMPGLFGERAGAGTNQLWDVVPGKSIGPVKMGMKSIEVHRALGVPKESRAGMREIWLYDDDLMVAFDTESTVIGVQMIRPARVQWKGRWIDGSHLGKDVVSAFGDPDFVSHWTYDDNDGVQYVVYGYRALGFGVIADPKTDRLVGFIIAEPEGEAMTEEEAPPAQPAPDSPPPTSP